MAANRMDASGTSASAPNGSTEPTGAGQTSAPSPAGGGGLAAWLPLAITIVAMPALAFATTHFLLLPKLQKVTTEATPSGTAATDTSASGDGEAKPSAVGDDHLARMEKVLVNVAGSMGSRYLMVKMTLASKQSKIKEAVKAREDQLVDLAGNVLSMKTITELDAPGARSIIRSELISLFNNALGEVKIHDIYFNEFAIQ